MPTSAERDEAVYCCFCGELLSRSRAAILTVAPPGARDATQTLFCHGTCFVPLLDGKVPYHSHLAEDFEAFAAAPAALGKPN